MKKITYHDLKQEKGKQRTYCVIQDEGMRFVGMTKCSRNDNYHRGVGRTVAENRAQLMYDLYKVDKTKNKSIASTFKDAFCTFFDVSEKCPFDNIPEWMYEEKKTLAVSIPDLDDIPF